MRREVRNVTVERLDKHNRTAVVAVGGDTMVVPVGYWVDADGDECEPEHAVVAVGGPLWPDEDRGYFVICDLDEFVPARLC